MRNRVNNIINQSQINQSPGEGAESLWVNWRRGKTEPRGKETQPRWHRRDWRSHFVPVPSGTLLHVSEPFFCCNCLGITTSSAGRRMALRKLIKLGRFPCSATQGPSPRWCEQWAIAVEEETVQSSFLHTGYRTPRMCSPESSATWTTGFCQCGCLWDTYTPESSPNPCPSKPTGSWS